MPPGCTCSSRTAICATEPCLSAHGDGVGAALLGRTDEQVLPSTERDAVIAAKRRVIATGTSGGLRRLLCDARGPHALRPARRARFSARTARSRASPARRSTSPGCARWRASSAGSSDEVRTTLQRYELALRESKVTVFTQDRNLRYTSISNPIAGLGVDKIIGGTDESMLDGESLDAVGALKRTVLDTGTPSDTDVSIRFQAGDVHWYDLHVEPLRDVTGASPG